MVDVSCGLASIGLLKRMKNTDLTALSPLDGRYGPKVDPLRDLFSEQGLIYFRTLVEVRWVQFLAQHPGIEGIGPFSPVVNDYLDKIVADFGRESAEKVKEIEPFRAEITTLKTTLGEA